MMNIRKLLTVGGDERMLYTGEVQVPLDEDEVRKIAKILVDEGIGIVAVCLLHSYANPSHELRIRDILKEQNRK